MNHLKQIKAVTYARFSSNNQREESIDAQLRAAHKYVSEQGYLLINDYIDEALTGTNMNRPAFLKMLEDAEKGLFDVVVVHKMDRFSRDVYQALDVEQKLVSYGVKIESVIEQFSDTPEGQLQQIIQLGVGQYYSANLAREVMKGLTENAYKAIHNGGTPPLGYDVDPKTRQYVINDKEADCIKVIFERFLEGWSYAEIANYLNVLGHTTKLGNRFSSKSSFYDILINPKYKGEYIFNRTVKKPKREGMKRSHRKNKNEADIIRVKDGLPAIITEETFEAVQKLLRSRQRTKGAKKAKDVYLVSGIVYCAECGSKYYGSARLGGRNKQKYVSYRCSKRNTVDKKCSCKEINRTVLDEFILSQMFNTVLNEKNIESLYEKVNVKINERLNQKGTDVPKLKKQLKVIDEQIANIVKAIALGSLSGLETITNELQRLEKEKVVLIELIEEQEQEADDVTITKEQIISVIKEAKLYAHEKNDEMLKYMISRFVNKITVSNEAIKVDYNFGGFFNAFKTMKLIEEVVTSRSEVYSILVVSDAS